MFAACCSLLGRSLFVTVAAPLVLVGSILFQVSVELEVQSLQNLRYAVAESGLAAGAEEEAARDVGEAALDQTEAQLLLSEAESLDADVASGAAGAQAAGEAAAAGPQGAELQELSEEVEEVATGVVKELPQLPAAEGSLEVAGEAAVDAVAATAAGAATPALGADAVLAGVAGTVAEEGPKVVAAAQEEWAVGSTELQAANDERMGVEKETQAGAMEADVPVLEASAVGAEEAASGSLLTAAGYLTAATASQLLALLLQVPVVAVFVAQWILDVNAKVVGKIGHFGQDYGHLQAVEVVSHVALYGAVCAATLTPWANVVVMAARFEEVGNQAAQQLAALPTLLKKAEPLFKQQKQDEKPAVEAKALRRRLWNWPEASSQWVSHTVDGAQRVVHEISEEGQEAAAKTAKVVGELEKDGMQVLKSLPNATKKAEKLLSQGEKEASKGVHDATDAAREGAVQVVKGLAFTPNTLTTTVTPLDIPPAPSALPYKHFLWSASNIFLHSVLYWLQPVATELLLISLAFVIFELVMGLGRHLGRDRKSGLEAVGFLFADVWSAWAFGLGVLAAFWIMGVLFSKELEPVALRLQASPVQRAVPVLGCGCGALSLYYAVAFLRMRPAPEPSKVEAWELEVDESALKSKQEADPTALSPVVSRDVADDSEQPLLRHVRTPQFCKEDEGPGLVLWTVSSVVTVILTILATLLTALEGPLISAAVGSSYKAALMSCWMWGLLPWEELLPQVFHYKLSLVGLLVLTGAAGALLGTLLFLLRRAC